MLGEGAYGAVFRVKPLKRGRLPSKAPCALKKCFDCFQSPVDAKRTLREITVLSQLKHPNVVSMHDAFISDDGENVYVVFDLMDASLTHVIRTNVLQEVHRRFLVYQLLLALKYVHEAKLLHRDVKPANILLDRDCNLKIM